MARPPIIAESRFSFVAGRLLRVLTVISTVLLAVSAILFLAGGVLNPWDHYLSLGNDFHIGVWGRGVNAYIVFFSDAEYGPYRGSIIQINGFPRFDREVWFGPSWGIYYRYFQNADGVLWTLMVTLWYPMAVFAILPAIRMLSFIRRHREHRRTQ